jgi:hypothetical protein
VFSISQLGERRVSSTRLVLIPCQVDPLLAPRKERSADVARGRPRGIFSFPFLSRELLTPSASLWSVEPLRRHLAKSIIMSVDVPKIIQATYYYVYHLESLVRNSTRRERIDKIPK